MSTAQDAKKAMNAWTVTDGSGMSLYQRTKKNATFVDSKAQKEFHLTEVDSVQPQEVEKNTTASGTKSLIGLQKNFY